jgi:hypothetical protein
MPCLQSVVEGEIDVLVWHPFGTRVFLFFFVGLLRLMLLLVRLLRLYLLLRLCLLLLLLQLMLLMLLLLMLLYLLLMLQYLLLLLLLLQSTIIRIPHRIVHRSRSLSPAYRAVAVPSCRPAAVPAAVPPVGRAGRIDLKLDRGFTLRLGA